MTVQAALTVTAKMKGMRSVLTKRPLGVHGSHSKPCASNR